MTTECLLLPTALAWWVSLLEIIPGEDYIKQARYWSSSNGIRTHSYLVCKQTLNCQISYDRTAQLSTWDTIIQISPTLNSSYLQSLPKIVAKWLLYEEKWYICHPLPCNFELNKWRNLIFCDCFYCFVKYLWQGLSENTWILTLYIFTL